MDNTDPRFPIIGIGVLDSNELMKNNHRFMGISGLVGKEAYLKNKDYLSDPETLEQKVRNLLTLSYAIGVSVEEPVLSTEEEELLLHFIKNKDNISEEDKERIENITNNKTSFIKENYTLPSPDEDRANSLSHEFRHFIQITIGEKKLELYNPISSILQEILENGFFEEIDKEGSFFKVDREELSEEEIKHLEKNLDDWFTNPLVKKYMLFRIAQEVSAYLGSELNDKDFDEIKEILPSYLLNLSYILNQYTSPILDFIIQLSGFELDPENHGEFETPEKVETVKEKFSEIAKKKAIEYSSIIMNDLMKIVEQKSIEINARIDAENKSQNNSKQSESKRNCELNNEIACYLDIMAAEV